MQINTSAVVIGVVKYGDHGLIVKCYTKVEGVQSYLLQGILKRKKGKVLKAHFLPFTLLDINASFNAKGTLNRITESTVSYPLATIHTDVIKQSIVFFLSEFLSIIFNEDEGENELLFDFLQQTILWLDANDAVANFHIIFLFELTRFLGFYPDEEDKNAPFFNLLEGRYEQSTSFHSIQNKDLELFNLFLGTKFDKTNVRFSRQQRKKVVDTLLKYYQLHLKHFRKPKTLSILDQILA